MLHHTIGPECDLCNEKLTTAHYFMATWFNELKTKYPEVHVAWAFRDQKMQDLSYEQGTSKLKWPNSKHNNIENGLPRSLALDIFLIIKGSAIFDNEFYQKVDEENKREGFPIEWGGSWEHFKDRDHFQLKEQSIV